MHVHLHFICGCFHIELSSCDSDHTALKSKHIYCLAIYIANLLILALKSS